MWILQVSRLQSHRWDTWHQSAFWTRLAQHEIYRLPKSSFNDEQQHQQCCLWCKEHWKHLDGYKVSTYEIGRDQISWDDSWCPSKQDVRKKLSQGRLRSSWRSSVVVNIWMQEGPSVLRVVVKKFWNIIVGSPARVGDLCCIMPSWDIRQLLHLRHWLSRTRLGYI